MNKAKQTWSKTTQKAFIVSVVDCPKTSQFTLEIHPKTSKPRSLSPAKPHPYSSQSHAKPTEVCIPWPRRPGGLALCRAQPSLLVEQQCHLAFDSPVPCWATEAIGGKVEVIHLHDHPCLRLWFVYRFLNILGDVFLAYNKLLSRKEGKWPCLGAKNTTLPYYLIISLPFGENSDWYGTGWNHLDIVSMALAQVVSSKWPPAVGQQRAWAMFVTRMNNYRWFCFDTFPRIKMGETMFCHKRLSWGFCFYGVIIHPCKGVCSINWYKSIPVSSHFNSDKPPYYICFPT